MKVVPTVLLVAIAVLIMCQSNRAGLRGLRESDEYRRSWQPVIGSAQRYMTQVSANRKLISVGDTVYMIGKRNRLIWKWVAPAPFTDAPVADSSGTIHVIGRDLMWIALDGKTGEEKWRREGNGSGFYSQIKRYRSAMYLVITNVQDYREMLRDPSFADRLSLCSGDDLMWESEVPSNSRIVVRGKSVFAVFKRHGRRVTWRVNVPTHLSQPIGKVTGWYPHP